jgi:hypothetical protein
LAVGQVIDLHAEFPAIAAAIAQSGDFWQSRQDNRLTIPAPRFAAHFPTARK